MRIPVTWAVTSRALVGREVARREISGNQKSLDAMGFVVGIVGTVASLVGVGIAYYTWWAPRRVRLDVRIAEPGDKYASRAVLTVHNPSERPIQVITMGFDLPKAPRQANGEPMVFQLWGDGGSFDPTGATYPPRTIAPGSSWQTYIHRSVLEDLLGRPPVVTAWVCTAERKCSCVSRQSFSALAGGEIWPRLTRLSAGCAD